MADGCRIFLTYSGFISSSQSLKSKLSDFLLNLHQSFAHQGPVKRFDISIGMPMLFANLAASRSWHIASQKIAQLIDFRT